MSHVKLVRHGIIILVFVWLRYIYVHLGLLKLSSFTYEKLKYNLIYLTNELLSEIILYYYFLYIAQIIYMLAMFCVKLNIAFQ